MKHSTLLNSLLVSLAFCFLSSATLAYEVCGNSQDGFILKCNDGHTNTSVVPPSHNGAMDICEDHGGIAAGYPRAIMSVAKAGVEKPSTCAGAGGTKAQDHNSSRSNKTAS